MRAIKQVQWRRYGMILVAGLSLATLLAGCKSAAPPAEDRTESKAPGPTAAPPAEPSRSPASIDSRKESTSEAAITGGVTGGVTGSAGSVARRKAAKHRKSATPQKPVPESPEDKLEEAVSHLKVGGLAYSFPEKMKTGQREDVVASIGSDKVSMVVLRNQLPTEEGQEVRTEQTPITSKMKLTLTSADFEITPQSSDEQIVAGTTPTTWRWTIAPKHSGKLHLHLAAVIELEDLKRDFTTVDRDIAVQIDPMDTAEKFVENNWQWMLSGTGGVAVVGAGWKLFKRKKESGDDDPV